MRNYFLFLILFLPSLQAADTEAWSSHKGWDIHYDSSIQKCFVAATYEDNTALRVNVGLDDVSIIIADEKWNSLIEENLYMLKINIKTRWEVAAEAIYFDDLPALQFGINNNTAFLKELVTGDTLSIYYKDRQIIMQDIDLLGEAIAATYQCTQEKTSDPFSL